MSAMMAERAKAWIGTPYRHQASKKGVGADCLGLVRGLWREVYGGEPQSVPPYRPEWAEIGGEEVLLEACRRWLDEKPIVEMAVGDVLLFRIEPGSVAKHCAVLTQTGGEVPRMVHAYWARSVVESWMGAWWQRRLVAVFGWPMAEGDSQ